MLSKYQIKLPLQQFLSWYNISNLRWMLWAIGCSLSPCSSYHASGRMACNCQWLWNAWDFEGSVRNDGVSSLLWGVAWTALILGDWWSIWRGWEDRSRNFFTAWSGRLFNIFHKRKAMLGRYQNSMQSSTSSASLLPLVNHVVTMRLAPRNITRHMPGVQVNVHRRMWKRSISSVAEELLMRTSLTQCTHCFNSPPPKQVSPTVFPRQQSLQDSRDPTHNHLLALPNLGQLR